MKCFEILEDLYERGFFFPGLSFFTVNGKSEDFGLLLNFEEIKV